MFQKACNGSILNGDGCGKCLLCDEYLQIIGLEMVMPVGELIECEIDNEWVNITVLAKGKNTNYIMCHDDGAELAIPNTSKWKPVIDKEQQKRNEILESWRAFSLENAHDNEYSMVQAIQFIDMLIDKEYIEVEK